MTCIQQSKSCRIYLNYIQNKPEGYNGELCFNDKDGIEQDTNLEQEDRQEASMPELTLYIGNRNYSSWSLRAWLALRHTDAAFREEVFDLTEPGVRDAIRRHSPSGRVPSLRDGDITVWDSLAIAEYLAEKFPEARLWPDDPGLRERMGAAGRRLVEQQFSVSRWAPRFARLVERIAHGQTLDAQCKASSQRACPPLVLSNGEYSEEAAGEPARGLSVLCSRRVSFA